jgi:hypothetical protein
LAALLLLLECCWVQQRRHQQQLLVSWQLVTELRLALLRRLLLLV